MCERASLAMIETGRPWTGRFIRLACGLDWMATGPSVRSFVRCWCLMVIVVHFDLQNGHWRTAIALLNIKPFRFVYFFMLSCIRSCSGLTNSPRRRRLHNEPQFGVVPGFGCTLTLHSSTLPELCWSSKIHDDPSDNNNCNCNNMNNCADMEPQTMNCILERWRTLVAVIQ